MLWIIIITLVLLILIMDIKSGLLLKRPVSLFLLILLSHIILIWNTVQSQKYLQSLPVFVFIVILTSYYFIRLTFHVTKSKIILPLRVRIMMGGRRIFLLSALAMILQIPLTAVIVIYRTHTGLSALLLTIDIIVSYLIPSLFLINGALRILTTSRRLGIIKRIFFLLFSWIPPVNIILGVWFCKTVKKEYIHEYINNEIQYARASSQICATKYPLLMLHGVGFRDYKYINYWGRIPALLIKNGASVFYGHQQAWGTIEDCAQEIKEKLTALLKETGCQKVNIIAHSKGGLDARYLISSLGMAPHTASLTTISTPHRGSELIEVLGRMKEKNYRKLCNFMDSYFKKLGDINPDAYASSRQLSPEYCKEFNKKNPDMNGVYYQSYAAQMKTPASHALLTLPHAVMKWVSGDNDGLVNIESAKWGEFKGVFKSSRHRGISHGDLIDLMRQDYEGFNIAEEYVSIVADLKNRGF